MALNALPVTSKDPWCSFLQSGMQVSSQRLMFVKQLSTIKNSHEVESLLTKKTLGTYQKGHVSHTLT